MLLISSIKRKNDKIYSIHRPSLLCLQHQTKNDFVIYLSKRLGLEIGLLHSMVLFFLKFWFDIIFIVRIQQEIK